MQATSYAAFSATEMFVSKIKHQYCQLMNKVIASEHFVHAMSRLYSISVAAYLVVLIVALSV